MYKRHNAPPPSRSLRPKNNLAMKISIQSEFLGVEVNSDNEDKILQKIISKQKKETKIREALQVLAEKRNMKNASTENEKPDRRARRQRGFRNHKSFLDRLDRSEESQAEEIEEVEEESAKEEKQSTLNDSPPEINQAEVMEEEEVEEEEEESMVEEEQAEEEEEERASDSEALLETVFQNLSSMTETQESFSEEKEEEMESEESTKKVEEIIGLEASKELIRLIDPLSPFEKDESCLFDYQVALEQDRSKWKTTFKQNKIHIAKENGINRNFSRLHPIVVDELDDNFEEGGWSQASQSISQSSQPMESSQKEFDSHQLIGKMFIEISNMDLIINSLLAPAEQVKNHRLIDEEIMRKITKIGVVSHSEIKNTCLAVNPGHQNLIKKQRETIQMAFANLLKCEKNVKNIRNWSQIANQIQEKLFFLFDFRQNHFDEKHFFKKENFRETIRSMRPEWLQGSKIQLAIVFYLKWLGFLLIPSVFERVIPFMVNICCFANDGALISNLSEEVFFTFFFLMKQDHYKTEKEKAWHRCFKDKWDGTFAEQPEKGKKDSEKEAAKATEAIEELSKTCLFNYIAGHKLLIF